MDIALCVFIVYLQLAVRRLCLTDINIYTGTKGQPGSFVLSAAWSPRNRPRFADEGAAGLSSVTRWAQGGQEFARGAFPAVGAGGRQEVPGADSPATPPRLVNAGRTRGAASTRPAPCSRVSSPLREVSAQAFEPHTRSPEPRPGRNRKRRPPARAPPAAAGARGGGCTGQGGSARGEAGGQVDRRAGTAPRCPYNSFPSLPPSQGGGWRHDGPGRAPAGRRRHLLPHRLPGLHGERAARPPRAWSRDPGRSPRGPIAAASSPDGFAREPGGSRSSLAYSRPWLFGPWARSRGVQKWGYGWPAGALLGEPLLGSPQWRRIPPRVDKPTLANNPQIAGLGGARAGLAVRRASCPTPLS